MADETSSPAAQSAGRFPWVPSVEKLTRWAQGIKSGAVTLLAAGTATIAGVGAVNAIRSDALVIEPIKVPATFEDRGFTSEITTARLLDDIVSYHKRSVSAKERVAILGKQQADQLEKLQTSISGINVGQVEKAVQDALGVRRERITGEITLVKQDGETLSNIRLRRLPGNQVLLDITVAGPPETVIKKTALAIIEAFDPHIAASIHWRERDEANAMRMIDIVLGNDRLDDDKFSLNLRGYIHITRKRLDAAQKDFERIMKIDPNFAPAYNMSAWLQRERGNHEASLKDADTTIRLAPDKSWGYFQKAMTLRTMSRADEAEIFFKKTLALKPDFPGPYLQAGQFLLSQGKTEEAEAAFRTGTVLFPDHAALREAYEGLRARGLDGQRY